MSSLNSREEVESETRKKAANLVKCRDRRRCELVIVAQQVAPRTQSVVFLVPVPIQQLFHLPTLRDIPSSQAANVLFSTEWIPRAKAGW